MPIYLIWRYIINKFDKTSLNRTTSPTVDQYEAYVTGMLDTAYI